MFFAEHTDARVHMASPRSSKPPLPPLHPPPQAHVTLAHIDSSMCAFWSSQGACCTAHNSYHPIHLLPPPYPLFPSRRHPRSRTLMQRAMQPPRRRLLLFPFFQFGWGAGSERATHSLIPFYFLAAYAPTLQTVSIHPLTCTPFSGGRPKEKYLYLSVSSRATSPLLVPTSVLPPLRNTILRHHLRDSLCLTYFLFLYRFFCVSFSFLLPSTTSYRDAARPRDGRRERGLDKTNGDRS